MSKGCTKICVSNVSSGRVFQVLPVCVSKSILLILAKFEK
jgi:hypothetical protein